MGVRADTGQRDCTLAEEGVGTGVKSASPASQRAAASPTPALPSLKWRAGSQVLLMLFRELWGQAGPFVRGTGIVATGHDISTRAPHAWLHSLPTP